MPDTERNKAIVREFYDVAFNQQQPAEAVRQHLGPGYKQHNPHAGDGPRPFITFVTGFVTAYPQLKVQFKRLLAEGDLVVVHSQFVRKPGDLGLAVMDIFRLDGDKIVEHWDVIQEVPAEASNSNTMF